MHLRIVDIFVTKSEFVVDVLGIPFYLDILIIIIFVFFSLSFAYLNTIFLNHYYVFGLSVLMYCPSYLDTSTFIFPMFVSIIFDLNAFLFIKKIKFFSPLFQNPTFCPPILSFLHFYPPSYLLLVS